MFIVLIVTSGDPLLSNLFASVIFSIFIITLCIYKIIKSLINSFRNFVDEINKKIFEGGS